MNDVSSLHISVSSHVGVPHSPHTLAVNRPCPSSIILEFLASIPDVMYVRMGSNGDNSTCLTLNGGWTSARCLQTNSEVVRVGLILERDEFLPHITIDSSRRQRSKSSEGTLLSAVLLGELSGNSHSFGVVISPVLITVNQILLDRINKWPIRLNICWFL